MGYRDNSHVHEEVYMGFNAKTRVFKAYMSIIYSNSCTYVDFLKETCVHIKKLIFRVFLGIFRLWCLLESFSSHKCISNGVEMRSNRVTKLKLWVL